MWGGGGGPGLGIEQAALAEFGRVGSVESALSISDKIDAATSVLKSSVLGISN